MFLLVVPTKKTQDSGVNDKEALEDIGQLIRDARLELGESQTAFAKRAGLNAKTLWSAETGARQTQDTNQYKLETALDWRHGAIADLWKDRGHLHPGQTTLTDMREGAGEETWSDLDKEHAGPLVKAMHLGDDELVFELLLRLRNYKAEIERLKPRD